MTDIRTIMSDIIASDQFVVHADYTQDPKGLRFQFIDSLLTGLLMNGYKIVPLTSDDDYTYSEAEAVDENADTGC